jgi:dihydroorotase
MQDVRCVIMQHCEEPALSGGAMHAGLVSTTLGLPGIPAEAEQLMIARDLLLNRSIGCRYHVQHISTAGSVELIRGPSRWAGRHRRGCAASFAAYR